MFSAELLGYQSLIDIHWRLQLTNCTRTVEGRLFCLFPPLLYSNLHMNDAAGKIQNGSLQLMFSRPR